MATFTLPIPLLTRRLRGGGTSVLGSTATVTVAAHTASITNGTDITFVTAMVAVAANTATIKVDASLGCSLATMDVATNAATINAETSFGCSLATMDVATNAATVLSVTSIECSAATIEITANLSTVVNVSPGGYVSGGLSFGPLVLGELIMPRSLRIASDNNVIMDRLRDGVSGAYLNSATVTAEVKDASDNVLATGVTCAYSGGGDGQYEGVIDAADVATVVVGQSYYVEVTITQGDYDDFRRVELIGMYHGVE